jgi:antitoxin HigA-1
MMELMMSKLPITIKPAAKSAARATVSLHDGPGPQPVHPGEMLVEEFLKPMGLSLNQVSRDIDVPVSRLGAIAKRERAVTADTALRLGHYFRMSAEFWLRLQADYDLRTARKANWPVIADRIRQRAA